MQEITIGALDVTPEFKSFQFSALNGTIASPVALQTFPAGLLTASLEAWNTLFEYSDDGQLPMRFYVNAPPPSLFSLNLAYTQVIESGKTVYEDALNHLADDLLGVLDGTLFANYEELVADIIAKSGPSGAVQFIRNVLLRLVVGSGVEQHSDLLLDEQGKGYMLSATQDNVCREVYRQMPPARKQNGKIVFEAGDRVTFKYTFHYLNEGAKTRSYTIKLNLQ
jgi:hypothetical protein